MSVEEFTMSVETGLKLSKRINYGDDPSMWPPKPPSMKDSVEEVHIPTAVMVYAVIPDPSIIDNPDIPSYQPYVYGGCNPPALIPLHMHRIEAEVDCYLDTVFVTVTGTWSVHCVAGSKGCDCRIALPMGEQGSVLGFEIEVSGRSYHSQLIRAGDEVNEAFVETEDGGFLKPSIYTLNIPQVDGGCKLLVKARWSQRLLYHNGHFGLHLPFTFPSYVTPARKISKREKIQLNVNHSPETEIICEKTSHHLKELRRQAGKVGLLYEAEVHTWSHTDFKFSFTVSRNDIFGGLLFQSPSLHDLDQREMFILYLLPGHDGTRKIFNRKVVFLVDASGSMNGAPIENVKKALVSFLSKMKQQDSFNIIAFNGETYAFSSSLELATQDAIQSAIQWIDLKLVADGSTNMLPALEQAIGMLSEENDSMPFIFLVTDGTEDNERAICDFIKDQPGRGGLLWPRISTFGIGPYCNHYFLRLLAHLGRGHYVAAHDTDSIGPRLQRLCTISSSVILGNLNVDSLVHLNSVTLYPSSTQDISYGTPLMLFGRYDGAFPESVTVRGTLADMSSFAIELKVQNAKDIPLDRVFDKRVIDLLTAEAWVTESKQLEEQITMMSIQKGVPSEYTHMILARKESEKKAPNLVLKQESHKPAAYNIVFQRSKARSHEYESILLPSLHIGFGDLQRTAENVPPERIFRKSDTTALIVKAASNCCNRFLDRCCCMCFINTCSRLNDQCAIVLSQLCAVLACCECLNCCYDLCL